MSTNSNSSQNMYVYSKQVKEKIIKSETITRNNDKVNIFKVINSLKEIGKCKNLNELEFNENCKQWIIDILNNVDNFESSIKYLLNDFTDNMMTRMREKEKYVISIISNNTLLLCHSIIGEQTITPFWQVYDRMLDKDNVERFVLFQKENDNIEVIYYEQYKSESFIRWLGISKKDAFYYFDGKNRLYVDYNDVHFVIELNDDEVESNLLIKNSLFTMKRNQLQLSTPIHSLEVNQIRVGKKRYNSLSDFIQEYLARRYELSYYQDEYQKLAGNLNVLFFQYIDDYDSVISITSDGEESIILRKRNPNFHIIFAGKLGSGALVEIRDSYFYKIFTEFQNENKIRIFHAGLKIYQQQKGYFKIGTLEIFNDININLITKILYEYIENTEIIDDNINNAIYYSIFYLLVLDNMNKPISYLFDKFKNEFGKDIKKSKIIAENEGDIIEFKSRDFIIGNDNEILTKIKEDVEKKIKLNLFKIYIFGVDDKSKKIETLSSNKFKPERINNLEKQLLKNIDNNITIKILSIPINNGDECIIIMFVFKNH